MPYALFMLERVLISGAAGSIGSALAKKIARQKPRSLILLDQDESGLFELEEEIKSKPIIASIRDQDRIDEIFKKYRPTLVFHCAAYKHVPLMQEYPLEALKTNMGGTLYMIEAAIRWNVKKFIFISTDKAVKPDSAMGLTKKYGELLCTMVNQLGKTKFIIVRFGNVMASRGSVIPVFQKQIQENKPLTVTSEKMQRYFMGIYDAVDLILQAAKMGNGGEIFVFDMGEPMFISDLAKLMLKLSGKDLPINIIGTRKGEKFSEELYDKEKEVIEAKIGNVFLIRKK